MKSMEIKLSLYREQLLLERLHKLRKDQNLFLGILGGIIAMIFCSVIWTAITIFTGYQIILMSLMVGFITGSAIRISGMAIDPVFRFIGAILALIGCFAGNLFSAIAIIADMEHISYLTAMRWLNYHVFIDIVFDIYHGIDLLFYLAAAGFAYYFSAGSPNFIIKQRV